MHIHTIDLMVAGILGMPNGPFLYADQLIDTLHHRANSRQVLLLFLPGQACLSCIAATWAMVLVDVDSVCIIAVHSKASCP